MKPDDYQKQCMIFLSTPSVWRATRVYQVAGGIAVISIHALRVEGDMAFQAVFFTDASFLSTPSVWRATIRTSASFGSPISISIHALRVEGDLRRCCGVPALQKFLSTPSVWRATAAARPTSDSVMYFYPRPPCGGRPESFAPSDLPVIFLSTPSVWRATPAAEKYCSLGKISIHALRVEGDPAFSEIGFHSKYFYPRPPCGGRPAAEIRRSSTKQFLSTPSVWRATGVSRCAAPQT